MYIMYIIWRAREKAVLPPGGSNLCMSEAAAAAAADSNIAHWSLVQNSMQFQIFSGVRAPLDNNSVQ